MILRSLAPPPTSFKVFLVMGSEKHWRQTSAHVLPSEKVVSEPQVIREFDFKMATYTFFGQLRQSKKKESSAPIGLNSLSKTFNIIQVVGQGILKLFVYAFEKERVGTVD